YGQKIGITAERLSRSGFHFVPTAPDRLRPSLATLTCALVLMSKWNTRRWRSEPRSEAARPLVATPSGSASSSGVLPPQQRISALPHTVYGFLTEGGGRANPSEGHAGDPDHRRGAGRLDARAVGRSQGVA